jgi:large subunit ribosomal protein L9
MQIILQEDIEKLGSRGDVVTVAEGYARNYLLPRKLALEASPGNLKRLEKIRTVLAKRTSTERDQAQKQAELLNGVTLNFSRKAGENDQLFGSVTAADITAALAAQGFDIDKRRIQLAEPIKVVGQYEVTAKLVHDVSATLKVHVTPEG